MNRSRKPQPILVIVCSLVAGLLVFAAIEDDPYEWMVEVRIRISEPTRQPCLTPTFGKCCDDTKNLGSLREILKTEKNC